MTALVGYTGFVGSNLYMSGQIDRAYNSKNIEEAYGLQPDLLLYAGLRAEKYLANNEPEKDMALITEAMENIRKIAPKKLVLISTIDVLEDPRGVNEDTLINGEDLQAYGRNRYRLECWVRENYPDALIIRLPGLFGKNIRKNFIYDYIHVIPTMLREDKKIELTARAPELDEYYVNQNNGFFKCRELTGTQENILKQLFQRLGFTALSFTDSRSVFQFYPLGRLWEDIQTALAHDIHLWHPATEPVSAGELYHYLTGEEFVNPCSQSPADYNFRTRHDKVFGGFGGYICNKERILCEIKEFIKGELES